MTAVLETPPNANPEATVRYPSWAARAGAFAIDVLPAVAVITTMALLAITTPQWGPLWWVFTVTAVLAFLAMVVNRWVLPPLTGWTLGRAVFGIRIVTSGDAPAGTARLVLRDVAHLLDTISLPLELLPAPLARLDARRDGSEWFVFNRRGLRKALEHSGWVVERTTPVLRDRTGWPRGERELPLGARAKYKLGVRGRSAAVRARPLTF